MFVAAPPSPLLLSNFDMVGTDEATATRILVGLLDEHPVIQPEQVYNFIKNEVIKSSPVQRIIKVTWYLGSRAYVSRIAVRALYRELVLV